MNFLLQIFRHRLFCFVAPLAVLSVLGWNHFSTLAPHDEPASAAKGQQTRPADWADAAREFEGVTDLTLELGAEEMPAYWRLVRWSQERTNSELRNMAARGWLSELVNTPRASRGKLVELDLEVCRVLSYEAPGNTLGIERLYEVWGWNDNSGGSLYVAVTTELPPGLTVGESVRGRAKLYGYFLKLQGYVAATSDPRSQPQAAPLLIGRLVRSERPVAVIAHSGELWRVGLGAILLLSFVGSLAFRFPVRRRTGAPSEQANLQGEEQLEAWLGKEQAPFAPSVTKE